MKRCPECRRDYYDDTLLYCLDDGNELLEGPASGTGVDGGPATAILHSANASSEAVTRAQIHTTEMTAVLPTATGDVVPKSNVFDKRLLAIPLLLAIIVLGGFFGYRYFSLAKQIESIAVMPFVNESGNADVEYLSDGMTETLISSLTQLPNLNVKARSSVFRYKGKETDAKTLGKELNVQAVLNGRVAQRGDQLILSLELVDAATENAIWSQQYNRKQTDLVSLQSEIARDVSNRLKTRLSGDDTAKVEKAYTANAEAYKLYLQGRFAWNKRTEKDFRKAIEFFNQAVVLDPNYALAYVGLADAYALLFSYNFASVDVLPTAKQNAERAMSIDPTLAEPHATLGMLHGFEYRWAEAEAEYKRSIELGPKYVTAYQWYAEMLTNVGRFDESSAMHLRSIEIDPLSLPLNWTYGRDLYFARRYDEALVQMKKTVELDPGFAYNRRSLSELYRVKGDYAAAVEERAKFYDLTDKPEAAALVRNSFTKGGWTGYLHLTASGDPRLEQNNWLQAKAFAELGDEEAALAEMQKAYERRSTSALWLKVDPSFDLLHDDPRYKDLMRRMNLPQ